MGLGDGPLGGPGRVVGRIGTEGGANPPTRLVGIGNRQEGTRGSHFLAIGLDQGDVDTVDGGAAHEAKSTQAG